MLEDYDVIVVGGGPAGLSAARVASAKGAEVLILELQAQIGGQTQTSAWVSSETLEKKFDRAVISTVKKIRLHSVHRDLEIEGDFGKIVDRKVLDKLLASEAVKKNVEIWVGSPVKKLLKGNEGVLGAKSEAGGWSEEIDSKILIDASGAKAEWSSLFLQKVLNSNWDKEKIAQTNEYLMANSPGGKKVDIYFNSILAPKGYAWIYPDRQEFAMAGIRGVRIHPDSALDEFIGQKEPERLRGSIPIGAYRGQLPVEGPLETTVADGIIAVGSSAGQTYPLSGHGMKYALKIGEIAGQVAAEGIREENTTEKKLIEYDQLWRNKFEKEIRVGGLLQRALETSPDQKMDALLEVLEGNPELQNNFINIFLNRNLEKSLKKFFKDEKCKRILGKKKAEKVLSLYS